MKLIDAPKDQPAILVYDIETTPILGWTWGMRDQNVLGTEQETYILCFAYRWYGVDMETQVVSLRDFHRSFKRNQRDDRMVLQALNKLRNQADIIVGHNVKAFDEKIGNYRCLVNGLPAPKPTLYADTLTASRKKFKGKSNKLKDLAAACGITQKEDPGGMSTWFGCMKNDPESWDRMEHYCGTDVTVTMELYELFVNNGWFDTHPNMALISGKLEACPKCGTEGRMTKRGPRYTKTVRYQVYQCGKCLSYSSERKAGKGVRFS